MIAWAAFTLAVALWFVVVFVVAGAVKMARNPQLLVARLMPKPKPRPKTTVAFEVEPRSDDAFRFHMKTTETPGG